MDDEFFDFTEKQVIALACFMTYLNESFFSLTKIHSDFSHGTSIRDRIDKRFIHSYFPQPISFGIGVRSGGTGVGLSSRVPLPLIQAKLSFPALEAVVVVPISLHQR